MLKRKDGKSVNSTKDLKGFDKLERNSKQKAKSVKIGFPAVNSKTMSTDQMGQTALMKATVNNFGLGVPKRPFMEVAFASNVIKYKKLIGKMLISGEDSNKIASTLGAVGQGDVQKAIVDLKSPPNAQSTIDAKGSSNPLIDTGHMRQSVTWSTK
jgi:hypothetical protein